MKWGKKEKKVPGALRVRQCFAWLPTIVEGENDSTVWIWLEPYHVHERCVGYYGPGLYTTPAYYYWEVDAYTL